VADFGGWEKVNATFFGDGGLWDQLFRQRRG
jgi:ABC-type sulfate transport system substrate-binding protein